MQTAGNNQSSGFNEQEAIHQDSNKHGKQANTGNGTQMVMQTSQGSNDMAASGSGTGNTTNNNMLGVGEADNLDSNSANANGNQRGKQHRRGGNGNNGKL